MQYREYFGQGYTEFFAWWPRRVTSGSWVWLDPYFIRPGENGLGVELTFAEVLAEQGLGENKLRR